jgi:hypothetical protein
LIKEKDLIDYEHGDISIKKVSNGWLLLEGSTHEEDKIMFSAYEADDGVFLDNVNGTVEDARALKRLLEDAFEGYLQTKHYGGISITFHKNGYSHEEDEEGEENK